MDEDRKLLEDAARAAGYEVAFSPADECLILDPGDDGINRYRCVWSPLYDNGEALELAVKLNLLILPYPNDKAVRVTRLDQPDSIVSFGTPPDPCAATRRAIVRAAAEIGRKNG